MGSTPSNRQQTKTWRPTSAAQAQNPSCQETETWFWVQSQSGQTREGQQNKKTPPDHFLLERGLSPWLSSANVKTQQGFEKLPYLSCQVREVGIYLSLCRAFSHGLGAKSITQPISTCSVFMFYFLFLQEWGLNPGSLHARGARAPPPSFTQRHDLLFERNSSSLFSAAFVLNESGKFSSVEDYFLKGSHYMLWVYMRDDYQR